MKQGKFSVHLFFFPVRARPRRKQKMESEHYALWERCRAFVGDICADRDASHGLGHMEKVTEGAVLLHLMARPRRADAEHTTALKRVILLGMLHDVADHKYDHDGQLMTRLEAFVLDELQRWDCPDGEPAKLVPTVMTAVEAVSFSKENRRGMRWFESALPREWVVARDVVSDADKLDAIGTEGLMRCYEYSCHVFREASKLAPADDERFTSLAALEAALLKEVADHYEEKLKRLASEFVVTPEGKFVALPRHEAMGVLLDTWKAQGPPPVTLYWPDAARRCGM